MLVKLDNNIWVDPKSVGCVKACSAGHKDTTLIVQGNSVNIPDTTPSAVVGILENALKQENKKWANQLDVN